MFPWGSNVCLKVTEEIVNVPRISLHDEITLIKRSCHAQ